jgi:PhoH-like ATPase
MKKRKTLVIDTSVLLYDMTSIHSFPGNDVVLPLTVLDELDRFKDRSDLLGESARYINRYLDGLRNLGRLDVGVKIEISDQTIRVLTSVPKKDLEGKGLDIERGDNQIISAALWIDHNHTNDVTKVITKDINLRVKCDALGIIAEDYYKDYIAADTQNAQLGVVELSVPDSIIDEFFSQGTVVIPEKFKKELFENCFVVMKGSSSSSKSALASYKKDSLQQIHISDMEKIDVLPRNKEQKFALSALTDENIPLVCLTGIAGSGKTFLTLMAALDGVFQEKYERIVVTRSIQPVGREIGFLPGDLTEKMQPWMAPLVDNFRHVFKDMSYFEIMMEKGKIDIAPLSFIRGRTFNDSFVIVDEAQNTTIHELKTIVTRLGVNSKIVLLGDTDQIDTPYIDKRSNGLSIVINKFKNSVLSSHVHLPKGERSDLATEASRVL